MSEEIIAIITTAVLSIVSLIISLKNYLMNKPKLKILISDKKCDAYYGTVATKNDKAMTTKIGAVYINIINNSPVDIFVKDIKLKVDKDYHNIVDKDNPYWEEAYFFYIDNNGEQMSDGCEINYKGSGIKIPIKVKSYTILSGICLFYSFPDINQKAKSCKIILNTAIGKVTKRVKLLYYDENYYSSEFKDVELFKKNQIKEKGLFK